MIIALDLEWYDQTAGRHITEVGIACEDPEDDFLAYYHYVVEENRHLKNRYCPSSPAGFQFGHTEILCLDEIGDLLWNMLRE